MSVQALAERTGVHHSSVSRMERGLFPTINPSVQKICTFFGVNPETEPVDAEALLLRLQRLSAHDPQVANALECLVEALEARCVDPGYAPIRPTRRTSRN